MPTTTSRALDDRNPSDDAPLSPQSERALLERWCGHGDRAAFDALVRHNQRLVRTVAHRYRGFAPIADLIQEGNIGLVLGLRKFDPARGVRLSTYAVWWIRATVLRYLEHNHGMVRSTTTRTRTRLFYQLARTRRQLVAAGGDASDQEVAAELGVSVEEVQSVEQSMRPDVSLDAPVAVGDGREAPLDRIADERAAFAERFEDDDLAEVLRDKLASFGATLSGRKAELFHARIATSEPVSLQHLGARWGVTREAARRTEQKVLLPLRRFLMQELGDALPPAPVRPAMSAWG